MSYKSHAETVRDNYRKQGERLAIEKMLKRINDNPHMTTQAVMYYLKEELSNDQALLSK